MSRVLKIIAWIIYAVTGVGGILLSFSDGQFYLMILLSYWLIGTIPGSICLAVAIVIDYIKTL